MRRNEIDTRITNKMNFMTVVENDISELESEMGEENAILEDLERQVAQLEAALSDAEAKCLEEFGPEHVKEERLM